MIEDPVEHFFASDESRLLVLPTLDALEEQAENADRTRSVANNVIESLRGSDVMRMASTSELGGVESSILTMGRELEAVAARCPSTAWCLWNHQRLQLPICSSVLEDDSSHYVRKHMRLEVASRFSFAFLCTRPNHAPSRPT